MHITLFAPALLWPEPGNHPALSHPALDRLLACSRFRRAPSQAMEDALCALFGYPERPAQGALRWRGESETPADDVPRLLCADPVHLRFDDERLILADSSRLDITADEAAQLTAALNAERPDLGRFVAANTERWYLRAGSGIPPARLDAPSLSSVAGRHVGALLPDILGDRDWRREVNALQTVLHAHPVNQRRAAEGRLTINSLWLWGDAPAENTIDSLGRSLWSALWSADPLACGLARHDGIGINTPNAGAAPLLAAAPQQSRSLIVLADPLSPSQYDDVDGWQAALATLDRLWFAPIAAAMKSGRVTRLEIVTTTAYGTLCWTCHRYDLWRFWRRPQPLATLATRLAKEEE